MEALKEQEAIQRKLDAFPEMLAALELFDEWDNYGMERGIGFRAVRKAIRAAIAKAKAAV